MLRTLLLGWPNIVIARRSCEGHVPPVPMCRHDSRLTNDRRLESTLVVSNILLSVVDHRKDG